MRRVALIAAFVFIIAAGPAAAQIVAQPTAPDQPPRPPMPARWHADLSVTAAREAWDGNDSTETVAGIAGGIDRALWRQVALRGEGLLLRMRQAGDDAWLRGFLLGPRLRWRGTRLAPFVDVGVGLSNATLATPPNGTTFNYLAMIGSGVAWPAGAAQLAVSARWLHVSNNGREGRARNPDLQSLGGVFSVGWRR